LVICLPYFKKASGTIFLKNFLPFIFRGVPTPSAGGSVQALHSNLFARNRQKVFTLQSLKQPVNNKTYLNTC